MLSLDMNRCFILNLIELLNSQQSLNAGGVDLKVPFTGKKHYKRVGLVLAFYFEF